MIADELRLLEVSIFGMLEKNLASINFSHLLRDIIFVVSSAAGCFRAF
jgi:hypothetical protein